MGENQFIIIDGEFAFDTASPKVDGEDKLEEARRLAREYKNEIKKFQAWTSGKTELFFDENVSSSIQENYETGLESLDAQGRMGAIKLYEKIRQLVLYTTRDKSDVDTDNLLDKINSATDYGSGATFAWSEVIGIPKYGLEGETDKPKNCYYDYIYYNKERILEGADSHLEMFGRLLEVKRANFEHKALQLVALMATGDRSSNIGQAGGGASHYRYNSDVTQSNGFLRQFTLLKYRQQLELLVELTSLLSHSHIGTQFLGDQLLVNEPKVGNAIRPIFQLENIFYPPVHGELEYNDFVNLQNPNPPPQTSGSSRKEKLRNKRDQFYHGPNKGYRLRAVDTQESKWVEGTTETLAKLAGIFLPGIKNYVRKQYGNNRETEPRKRRGQQMLAMVYRKFISKDTFKQFKTGNRWEQQLDLIDKNLYKTGDNQRLEPNELVELKSRWKDKHTLKLAINIEKTIRKTKVNVSYSTSVTKSFALIETLYKTGVIGYAWYNGTPQGFRSTEDFLSLTYDALVIAGGYTNASTHLDVIRSLATKAGAGDSVEAFLDSKVAKFCSWADDLGWKLNAFGIILNGYDTWAEYHSGDYDAAAAMGATTLGAALWAALEFEFATSTIAAPLIATSSTTMSGTVSVSTLLPSAVASGLSIVAGLLIIGGTIAYIYFNDPNIVDWANQSYFGANWDSNRSSDQYQKPGRESFHYYTNDGVNWNRQLSRLREIASGHEINVTQCRYRKGTLRVKFEPTENFIRTSSAAAIYVQSWIVDNNAGKITDRPQGWRGIAHRLQPDTNNAQNPSSNWIVDGEDDVPLEHFGNAAIGDNELFAFKRFTPHPNMSYLQSGSTQELLLQVHPSVVDTDAKFGLVGIDTSKLESSPDGSYTCYLELIYVPPDVEHNIARLGSEQQKYLNRDFDLDRFRGVIRERVEIDFYPQLRKPDPVENYLADNMPTQ